MTAIASNIKADLDKIARKLPQMKERNVPVNHYKRLKKAYRAGCKLHGHQAAMRKVRDYVLQASTQHANAR